MTEGIKICTNCCSVWPPCFSV